MGLVDNPDRIIKYIAIYPSKYYTYTMVDLRIHEIRLETNCPGFSAPAYGFIEDCKNTLNLPKDLSFGWGVITDGSLVTPSDADYVTPTSMTEYAPNWHGPNFVHVLDQPLRLHELDDFAVTGEIVQSVNTLGKMDVALFDENKQIVMNIGWGDAWRDLIQASFWVTYYPEGGSASGASVGYFDTSFVRTGRMWYEDGNIKYEIEQSTGVQTGDLGPAANPYRLIKYVVVRPSQSGGFSMVDLRIRQISVTSGFRVPTEQSEDCPVPLESPQDESTGGVENDLAAFEDSNPVVDDIGNYFVCYLLPVFWPTMIFQLMSNLAEVLMEFTIDLLGIFALASCIILNWIAAFLNIVESIVPLIEVLVKSAIFPQLVSLWYVGLFAWWTVDTLRNTGFGIGAAIGAALGATILTLSWMAAFWAYVLSWLSAGLTYQWAACLFLAMFVIIFTIVFFHTDPVMGAAGQLGFQLTCLCANFISRNFLNNPLEWNPIMSTGTIIFKGVTLGFLFGGMLYFWFKHLYEE